MCNLKRNALKVLDLLSTVFHSKSHLSSKEIIVHATFLFRMKCLQKVLRKAIDYRNSTAKLFSYKVQFNSETFVKAIFTLNTQSFRYIPT